MRLVKTHQRIEERSTDPADQGGDRRPQREGEEVLPLKCLWCQIEFIPKHRRHFYCSTAHKDAAYRATHPKPKPHSRMREKGRLRLAKCDFCQQDLRYPPWPEKIGDKVACDSCVGKMVRKAA